MVAEHRAVAALRVFLVVLFGILVLFQTMSLPGQFAHMAEQSPDLAHLRWPMTAVTVFWVLCVQVVIVATWQLLTLVRDDRIFSDVSLVWVDTIVGAIGAAELLLLGAFAWSALTWEHPGLPVALLVVLVAGAALGLLVVVMRALLRQATALRTDMDAVI